MMKKHKTITLNMGLCEGRHEIPHVTDGYIYFRQKSTQLIYMG